MAMKGQNLYSIVKNNKEILEKRKQVTDDLDCKVTQIIRSAPGRVPAWNRERLLQMDKFCLEHQKRCVMWDDEGDGFYLLLNWDWLKNKPRHPPQTLEKFDPGWWSNVKQMLRMPLIDPGVSDDELASWIDANTMAIHQFLGKLHQVGLPASPAMTLPEKPPPSPVCTDSQWCQESILLAHMQLRQGTDGGKLVLDDPYYQELQPVQPPDKTAGA